MQTVEGLLRAEFKDSPGESKLLRGYYCIVNAGCGHLNTERDWCRSVFPGLAVLMSVRIARLRRQSGIRPRPSCQSEKITYLAGLDKVLW